jgi:hypothetical protein
MPPPFDINATSPGANDLISAFPANEQSNRAEIEEWLTFISDPATGMIRDSVLPSEFPAGTRLTFQQTAAPTGWTKITTYNNRALRIVSGTVSFGGSVPFTTAFASQAVTGSNSGTTVTGSNSSETVNGTTGSTTQGGTVNSHTLTTSEIPAHDHTYSGTTTTTGSLHTHLYSRPTITSTIDDGTGTEHTVWDNSVTTTESSETGSSHTHTYSGTTANAGGGGGHSHTFTGSGHTHTFTSNTHTHTWTATGTHTHTFTGTSINLAVDYVDVIFASKDA